MKRKLLTARRLNDILEIARLAPSVHNTQPWKVHAEDNALQLIIDSSHSLSDGDPTGRQTYISLGIFAEAVKIGAEACGLKAMRVLLTGKLARISFTKPKLKKTDKTVATLLGKRASDRSVYEPAEITVKEAASIKNAWKSSGVKIWIVNDKEFIEDFADFTSKGIGLALSNPSFRKELSEYLVPAWSKKDRGISVKSLYLPPYLAFVEPVLMKFGIGMKQEAKLEKRRWLSSSALVLITSKGDLHKDWFEVGRAYLRASLAIEKLGLSQATSAATVEASTFHEDIEEKLGTKQRLQSSLRIGKGVAKRKHSPRVGAQELIA